MGLWFFLTVVVVGNMVLKAYKWRIQSRDIRASDDRMAAMEEELKAMREKVRSLEHAVFLDDFELKRQFSKLEQEVSAADRRSH
ncbi:MAG TPA: hypothetical protein VEL47_01440 [Myxococcota bacterium]|nr:hypothetical protein [Myxococcota bacterium]